MFCPVGLLLRKSWHVLDTGVCAVNMPYLCGPSWPFWEVDSFVNSLLKLRTLRLREAKKLAQDHRGLSVGERVYTQSDSRACLPNHYAILPQQCMSQDLSLFHIQVFKNYRISVYSNMLRSCALDIWSVYRSLKFSMSRNDFIISVSCHALFKPSSCCYSVF